MPRALTLTTLALLGALSLAAAAAAQPPWNNPDPRQVEQFLAVFAPDLQPDADLASYALPVRRLVGIEEAYSRGDLLTTVDRILANPDGPRLSPIAEAQSGLAAARNLTLWWEDEEARGAFLGYYTGVYLKDPALTEPEAFATRFLEGASTTDEANPARFIHQHLDRYGYSPLLASDPPTFVYGLVQGFDALLLDAARLGITASSLDLAGYRTAVLNRLISQITAARQYTEARETSVAGWGELIAPVTQPETTPSPPVAAETSTPSPTPTEAPVVDPVPTPEPVAAPEPAPEPTVNWGMVDVFAAPGGAPTEPASAPIEPSPAPSSGAGDPEAFADPNTTSPPETGVIEELPAPPTTPTEPEAAPVEAPPGTPEDIFSTPAPEPAPVVEPEVMAMPETPAQPTVEEARLAGQSALDATIAAAASLGGQATDLVLLWNGESPDPAVVATAEEEFQQRKEFFLAHLYLIDLYGVATRLGMAPESLDAEVLEGLNSAYQTRSEEADTAVLANAIEIEQALGQIADGLRKRNTSDTIQRAQQVAYEHQAGKLEALALQLEETLIEGPSV